LVGSLHCFLGKVGVLFFVQSLLLIGVKLWYGSVVLLGCGLQLLPRPFARGWLFLFNDIFLYCF
jgi:hypothetical protein